MQVTGQLHAAAIFIWYALTRMMWHNCTNSWTTSSWYCMDLTYICSVKKLFATCVQCAHPEMGCRKKSDGSA